MATPLLFPPLWCWATTWKLCFTKGTANLGAMDINQTEALHCRALLVDNNKRWEEGEEDKWRNISSSSHLTPAQSCSLVLNHGSLASMCSCKLVNCPNQLTCFAHFDLCTCVSFFLSLFTSYFCLVWSHSIQRINPMNVALDLCQFCKTSLCCWVG